MTKEFSVGSRWYLQHSRLLHFTVTIAERLQMQRNQGAIKEEVPSFTRDST